MSQDETFRAGTPHPASSATASFENLGEKIGQYAIIRKLGAGAMGEVWLAHDMALKRDVALKVLPPAIAADPSRKKRFVREARLAAQLNHPHAVTIYQICAENERLYIAMEYVDGKSLDCVIAENGALEWSKATHAIRDAASALQAAHDIQLVHRDIKPSNLMYSTKSVTKVVDFGLARLQSSETQLTQDGRLVGTPAYMSPEQWQGGSLDGRSDLYSLACTYYFLLTGKAPFEAATFAALSDLHRSSAIPDPLKLCPGLPAAISRIVARGAAKDPANRYQTAGEMIADLDAVMADPQSFKGPKSPRRSGHWVTAALIAAMVAGGVFGAITILNRQPPPPPVAARLNVQEGELVHHRIEWPAAVEFPPKTVFQLAEGAPAGAYFNGDSGEFFWRANRAGTHMFTVLASIPGDIESKRTTFSIEVAPQVVYDLIHSHETLPPIPNQTVDEDMTLAFQVYNHAVQEQHGPLRFDLLDPKPVGATIDSNSGMFRWTPGEADVAGPHPIKLRVSRSGATSQETVVFNVVVREVNSAPLLHPITDKVVEAGLKVSFSTSAEDTDLPRKSLTYAVVEGPPGVGIDQKGEVLWNPRPADLGQSHKLTIRVTDAGDPPAKSEQSLVVSFTEPCDKLPLPSPDKNISPNAADKTGKSPLTLVRTFSEPRKWPAATCGAISPAVNYMATAQGFSVLLWDLTTPSKPLVLSGLTSAATELSFSPDNSLLMAIFGSPSGPQRVLIWETRDGRQLLDKSDVFHATFTTANRQVAYMWDNHAQFTTFANNRIEDLRFLISGKPRAGAEGPWKFSPDGKHALIRWSGWLSYFPAGVTPDRRNHGLVRLYDLDKKRDWVKDFKCRTDLCEFSADGKSLAIIDDLQIDFYDTATGLKVFTLPTDSLTEFMKFSPDGHYFAAGETTTVKIWQWPLPNDLRPIGTIQLADRWESIKKSHGSEVPTSVTFCKDNQWLIIDHLMRSNSEKRGVQLWNLRGGLRPLTTIENYEILDCWATDHQGRCFISASADGFLGPKGVTIWDANLKRSQFFKFDLPVYKAAVDPRGQAWAMLNSGELCRFNVQQPVAELVLSRNVGWNAARLSARGRRLMSYAGDGQPALRDVATANLLPLPYSGLKAACLDGSAFATLRGQDIVLHNLDDDSEQVLHSPGAAIVAISWDREGRSIASLHTDGSLYRWNLADGTSLKIDSRPIDTTASIAIAEQVVAVAERGEVKLWNPESPNSPKRFQKRDEKLQQACLSADGKHLATLSDNGQITLWNTAQVTIRATWRAQGLTSQLEFSRDGRLLFSRDHTSTRFWDVPANKEFELPNSSSTVGALRPDGKLLVTADAAGKLHLWDMETRARQDVDLPVSHSQIADLGFSPTGRHLTIAYVDGSIEIYRMTTTNSATAVTEAPTVAPTPAATGVIK